MPGDPGPWRRFRYALGFRLPPENLDWVRHDLTDAGWRGRMMVRHLAIVLPCCVVLAALPAEWWIRVLVAAFALSASTLVVLVTAAELRAARLHQHGLRAPGD
ncbi:MAG TPA: DUF5313 family protein [Streptosporangiaceae bacterium]|nr:DUF5313 family protein [Streptosporangiaceae bacterium]